MRGGGVLAFFLVAASGGMASAGCNDAQLRATLQNDEAASIIQAVDCGSGDAADLIAASTENGNPVISLLTGPNNPPLSDPDWPAQGLMTELVEAAFDASPEDVQLSLAWEEDWSAHLFPMLDDQRYDMGFPWFRPDCDVQPDDTLCSAFHFSDPVLDLVVLLFVRADAPVRFEDDTDVVGRILCRPAGFATHMLDGQGRGWLKDKKISLKQPSSPDACFEMLVAGDVEGVVLNEFVGVQKLFELNLTEKVVPLPRPVSVEGLHVVISRKHWQGTTHLYRFNAGLAALRQTPRYDEIIARHLKLFWDRIKG